jgi:hypothetical protein
VEVGVTLLNITPSNPLEEFALPISATLSSLVLEALTSRGGCTASGVAQVEAPSSNPSTAKNKTKQRGCASASHNIRISVNLKIGLPS